MHLKKSNIRQAENLGKKLHLIRCGIWLATDDKKPDFSFTGGEIELLAKKEHERWMTEKFPKGWADGTYGLTPKGSMIVSSCGTTFRSHRNRRTGMQSSHCQGSWEKFI